MIVTVLLIIALILFILAGIGVPAKTNLGWWGLAFVTVTMLIANHIGL